MLEIIKSALRLLLNDMDSGNSLISESELEELLLFIERINELKLNRTKAAEYLGVSVGTISNYVDRKLLPEGIKKAGSSQKFWLKKDLNKLLKK